MLDRRLRQEWALVRYLYFASHVVALACLFGPGSLWNLSGSDVFFIVYEFQVSYCRPLVLDSTRRAMDWFRKNYIDPQKSPRSQRQSPRAARADDNQIL